MSAPTAADHARAAAILVAGFLMILLPTGVVPKSVKQIQRPLRIAQSWGLYAGGPNKIRKFEVWVDGDLKFRGGDREHDWLRSELRYRRIRPVAGTTCRETSGNTDVLLVWLAKRARQDFPGAQSMTVRCTVDDWPGVDPDPTEILRFDLSAPDWTAP